MMGAAPHIRQGETPGGGGIGDAGEVREATTRLPERQREALTLDTGGRSYEEIAAAMGTNRDAVAQLIARARINLYDELRGTPLASVVPSPDCERALPLIAMGEDGQIEPSSGDTQWIEAHLAECGRCRLGEEQMRAAAAAFLLAPALAAGTDSGERKGGAAGRAPGTASQEATVGASGPAAPAGGRARRRVTFGAASAVTLLLLAGVALALTRDDRPTTVSPAAGATTEKGAGQADRGGRPANGGKTKSGAAKRGVEKKTAAGSTTTASSAGEAVAAESTSAPTFQAADGGAASGGRGSDKAATGQSGGSGEAAIEPTHQTAASKPSSSKPKATPAPAPAPTATAPAPAPAPSPAPEEQPDGPGRSDEAPGKPADRPPH